MTAFAGVKIPSYADDLYEKYHIEYDGEFISLIAIGRIEYDAKYDLKVWNLFYDADKTYSSIDVAGNAGVSVVDNNSSTTIVSLENNEFELYITETGKYLINNTITWDFPSGDPVLTLTGTRGVILPYRPEREITESLKFATDIIESYDGDEQRIPMRFSPEQAFTFKYYLESGDYDSLELIFLLQNTKFYIPIWTMKTRTADNLPYSTPLRVRCDTTGRGFTIGDSIIIWDAKTNYEVVTVSAVDATYLEFTETLTGTYTKPYVIPIRQTFIEGTTKSVFTKHKEGYYNFNYKIAEPLIITGYLPTYSLNSIPIIYDYNHYDGDTNTSNFKTGNQFIDFNTGLVNVKPFWTVPKEIKGFGWYKNTFAEIYELYQFLHYIKGRQKVFYAPTFYGDFQLSSAYTSTDTYIDVVNNGQDELYNSDRRNAIVVWLNGTAYPRQINSIIENTDGTLRVTLASAFGVNLASGSYGSWLVPYRLDSDTIELKWDMVGEIKISTTFCEINNN